MPSPPGHGPTPAPPPSSASRSTSSVSRFASALALAPGLKVVQAELPAVWNTALLEISNNASLEAIRLSPAPPVAGAHIFLAEARKHPRLAQLIERGTPRLAAAPRVAVARPGRAASRMETGVYARGGSVHGRVRANTTVATTSSVASGSRCEVAFPVSSASASGSGHSASGSAKSSETQGAKVPPTAKIERRPSRGSKTSRRQSKTSRRMSAV